MSKSTGFGATTSTEQIGRTRTGTSQRSTTGATLNNYQDVPNLPRIKVADDSDIVSFKSDFKMTNVPDAEVAAMFGALNGSRFRINKEDPDSNDILHQYKVKIDNEFLEMPQVYTIKQYKNGMRLLSMDVFYLKTQTNPDGTKTILDKYKNQGIGTKSVTRQAIFAAKHGVNYLVTIADKDDDAFGHYAWAKVGYNRKLTLQERTLAVDKFKDSSIDTVLDILAKKDGDNWWFQYGNAGYMSFNLAKGSRSFNVLKEYAKKKLSKNYSKLW